MIADVLQRITAFDPGPSPAACGSKEQTLTLLRATDRPLARDQFVPGHMTASAVVLSPDRTQLLLVFHRRLGRWLQPGGHVEPKDASILETALREVAEETCATVDAAIEPVLAGIDVHEIPGRRA